MPLARGGSINYHLCEDEKEQWLILAIAKELELNVMIDRLGYIIQRLDESSQKFERLYAEQNGGGKDAKLHYDWLYPHMRESFKIPEQGNRRAMIIEFLDVDASKLMPLSRIMHDKQRVDLKTNAWMMGRMLKLLGFLHDSGLFTTIRMDNFVIAPERHHLVLLNFQEAQFFPEVSEAQRCVNIKQAAECAMQLLGAEYRDGSWIYPYGLEEGEEAYLELLQSMFQGVFTDAFLAHKKFYVTVHGLWGRKYHPFTTYERR